MAKRNFYDYGDVTVEVKEKRGTTVGRIIAFLLCVVLLAVVAGAGAWGMGFAMTGKANPLEWDIFKPATPAAPAGPETSRTVAVTSDGQEMKAGEAYAMPTGFTFLSTRMGNVQYVAGGEIILTAELSNEHINGVFDWSADFADASSEWAQGKVTSYYMGLEPIDGGRQVKVNYLAPFGEQIILTATLQGTESAASCTIDCLKGFKISDPEFYGDDFSDVLGFDHYVEYGIGTITGDFVFEYARLALDLGFINNFKNYLNFDVTVKVYAVHQEDIEFIARKFDYQGKNGVSYEPSERMTIDYSMFIEGFDDYDEVHKEAIYYAWYRAYLEDSSQSNVLLDIKISYFYADVLIDTFMESDLIGMYLTGYAYGADIVPSVTLSKNLVF